MLTIIIQRFRYSAVSSPNPVPPLFSPKCCALSNECSWSSFFNNWGSDFCNQSCLVGFLQPCGNYCPQVNYNPTRCQPAESQLHRLGQSWDTKLDQCLSSYRYSYKPMTSVSRHQRHKSLLFFPTPLQAWTHCTFQMSSIAHWTFRCQKNTGSAPFPWKFRIYSDSYCNI